MTKPARETQPPRRRLRVGPLPALRLPLGPEHAELTDILKISRLQKRVPPYSLKFHPDLFEHTARGNVPRKMVGMNPLQVQNSEALVDKRARRFGRVTLPSVWHTYPVTQLRAAVLG